MNAKMTELKLIVHQDPRPPFYQLILLVFGLKYAIFLHWQQKMKIWPFLSGFRMTEVQWYKPGTVI